MRISIAQINFTVGDFSLNAEKILAFAEKAKNEEKADMVLFPEFAIPGSPVLDLADGACFVARNIETVHALREKLPKNIAVGFGFIGSESAGEEETEKRLVNSWAIILNGNIVFEQSRPFFSGELPAYQRDFFEKGRGMKVFDYLGESILFPGGGDIFGESGVPPNLNVLGVSLLCVPAALPYCAGAFRKRLLAAEKIARTRKLPLVCINAVGGNGETIFDGRSFVITPASEGKGYGMALANAFEEDLITYDFASPAKPSVYFIDSASILEDSFLSRGELDDIEEALVLGIRDYMKKSGFTRAHLGLSGGIDSSLVAYLAVRAAGAENVTCFSMPSRFSSPGSRDDARAQALTLGCRFETLPIEDCYKAFLDTLAGIFENRPFDVSEENLQPRIRGTLLMAYSNKFNSMLLSPGNKSEIAMGYCTLYGDMCGALGPIGDLFKTEVIALCERINERALEAGGRELIPRAIIDKPPSAELRPNQKDEDSLPPYPILDKILEAYLCENLSAEAIVQKGFDRELVNRIIKTAARAEFKRRQAAPLLAVSKKPFGILKRMPIVRSLYEI